MKYNKKLLFGMIVLVAALNFLILVNAAEFNVYMPKENYTFNETVSVSIEVETFDEGFEGFFVIDSKEPERSFFILEDYFEEINLDRFDRYYHLHTIHIGENTPNGKYNLILRLIDKLDIERLNKNITFNVIGVKEPFKFNILLPKKIFIKDENINLDYESEVPNPEITATLTYPNGKIENINLPTTLKASQIGTYELEVTTSKTGYKTITKKTQFGVIEKPAEIEEGAPRPTATIPKDLKEKSNFWTFVIIGLIVLILVASFLIYRKIKKQNFS